MNDIKDNLIRIFSIETGQGGRGSILWTNPQYLYQPDGLAGNLLFEEFEKWKNTKCEISFREVVKSKWIKIGDHGLTFIVRFYDNGSCREYNIFENEISWMGSWKITNGILIMTVKNCDLYIITNRLGIIHSGIEIDKEKNEPVAYYKIIHPRIFQKLKNQGNEGLKDE